MKRILLLFSSLMLSCIALWAHDVEIGGIYYNLDETNKTAEVTYRGDYHDEYYDEYRGSVTIPETITYYSQTYSVTYIGPYAFDGCSGLTSITIPNSVTSIGSYAFIDCSGLTKVNYLGTVDKWVKIDFRLYDSNPTYYADDLYINNELLTDVKITTNSIKNYAFYNCQSIKSVEIGNSVTSIGSAAFYDCSGLTSVTIPNSVTSIGEEAFKHCYRLTSITIPNSVKSIGKSAFSECSGLTSVTIPNSVTSIGSHAFFCCYRLTSATIPNSVTSIGEWAFFGCYRLTSITIPNSVTSIGYDAFSSCSGLTSVTFGESVTSIGSSAFSGCSGLTEVTIPNSVTSIGGYAFSGCSGLTSVIWNAKNCADFSSSENSPFYDIRSSITSFTFGNEVEHIPAYLCYGMSKLTEMTIPNSVTSIGQYAFKSCSGLTSVIWNAKNCADFSSPENSPFYDIRSNITSFTFDNEVEHIPAHLCYGMSTLTEVTIPNSVTSISYYAFNGCSNLTSVIWNAKHCKDFEYDSYFREYTSPFYNISSKITSFTFGNEVEHIPAYLCYDMENLKEVTIGNSVTSIGYDAFYNCSGLTSVIWNAKNYKDFSSYSSSPFYDIRSNITSFTFDNEVEHIPAYLCYGMSKLTEITIPNSVTSIGSSAFSSCSGLTKVNYLGAVDKWVEIDFNGYDSNPTYYAKDLYINNELLTDVKITTADSIKNHAFYNCQSIKSVEIGESVTSIGSSAFSGCSGLTSVTIPNSVTTIGSSAFSGCEKLRKVTAYPTTVPNVYKSSFAHYNAALYVPCDVYDDYFFDDVFGTFKVTECIAAEEVDAPEKVEIEVDEDNNANVIWPSTDGAKKYELEISKDGEVFCTLLFNENGQLTSIDFGNRSASLGFQFTVTGLDGASKYAYSMVAMDKKGNELQSYKGTFTTNGYVPGPGEEDEPVSITETLADANITVSGGTISADADFSIYNTIGQDVTSFNGSLQPGVYLVSIENNIVKVMVK